jgi:hypothetical protein
MRRLLGIGLVTAATVVGLVTAVITGRVSLLGLDVMLFAASVAFVVVGIVVVARSAATRVGWALALIGLSLLGSGLFSSADGSGAPVSPGLAGPSSAAWYGTFAGIGMLMAWFPTGTAAGRRWSWLTPFGVAVTALVLGSGLLSERVCMEATQGACLSWAANPIGIRGVPNVEYEGSFVLGLLVVFVLMAAVSLVFRFVHSVGVERLQLKWFATAVGLFALWLAVGTLTELAGIVLPDVVGDLGVGVVMLALPVAVGIAVTRYRLYEIDRIVSRTVTYGAVALVVAIVYAVPVIALPRFLGESNDLVIAGSTLAAAAVFNPARRRIQRIVDHRFNRARFDAEHLLEVFAADIANETELATITNRVQGLIASTVEPEKAGTWIRS